MNFYASRDFLDAAAAVWFKGRAVAIEDVQIGDDVLRLPVIDGRKVITKLQFLDYHEPLTPSEMRAPERKGRYAQHVVRGAIPLAEWEQDKLHRFNLAPYIDWSQFRSFDEYRSLLLERHRSLFRDRERRWRKLASTYGELVFTMDDLRDDVLPFAEKWKSRQLRETGFPDYFALPQTMEFLQTLRARNLLVASTLRAGDRLAAVWIGFVHQGIWSGWVLTYDPEFRRHSAGHKLISSMLERSWELGHRQFDFSEGGEDYKMVYATHGRLLGEIGRPPLARTIVLSAKNALRTQSPALLKAVQNVKRTIGASLARRPVSRAGA